MYEINRLLHTHTNSTNFIFIWGIFSGIQVPFYIGDGNRNVCIIQFVMWRGALEYTTQYYSQGSIYQSVDDLQFFLKLKMISDFSSQIKLSLSSAKEN